MRSTRTLPLLRMLFFATFTVGLLGHAHAIVITETFEFTALDLSSIAPTRNIVGSVTLTLDPAGAAVVDQPVDSITLTLGSKTYSVSEVGFNYNPASSEVVAVGGLIAQVANLASPFSGNFDFQFAFNRALSSQTIGGGAIFMVYVDCCKGGNLFNSVTATITKVVRPLAAVGPDQTVNEGEFVTLDGSGSSDPQGDPLTFAWTQIAGPTVSLDLTDPAHPTFSAPFLNANTTLTFQLTVTDDTDSSDPATVDITAVNVNSPPIADAGNDFTIKEGATATLNGVNSFDPEGDSITFEWIQVGGPTVTLLPASSASRPTFVAPLGALSNLVFQLQVSDGKETSIATPLPDPRVQDDDIVAIQIVQNSAPIANAGVDQTKDEGSTVQLNGLGSSDPDGDGLSYQWSQVGGPTITLSDSASPTPTFTAPFVPSGGDNVLLKLVVTDNDPVNPKSSPPAAVQITVRNINDPPRCNVASPSLTLAWPPNHKTVPVEILNLVDPEGDTIEIVVNSITQDEAVSGLFDGDTSPDGFIIHNSTNDTVLLRSERDPNGNGRVYVVGFTATDRFGESCNGTVTVNVPHSRLGTAVDDGQIHDSTLQ